MMAAEFVAAGAWEMFWFHGLSAGKRFVPSNEAEAFESGIRSEEHTSELQSRQYLVCRLLLEKKKQPRIWKRCFQADRLQDEAPGRTVYRLRTLLRRPDDRGRGTNPHGRGDAAARRSGVELGP